MFDVFHTTIIRLSLVWLSRHVPKSLWFWCY